MRLIDQPVPLLLLVIPVFSTLIGGLLAICFRRSLVLLIALGTGLLLGEAIAIGLLANWNPTDVLTLTLVSFLGCFGVQYSLDALATLWKRSTSPNGVLGWIGGGMLIFHSLRDGMAIGLSYAASHPTGYAVAIRIVAHDIGDGMNTVILTTGGEKPGTTDYPGC